MFKVKSGYQFSGQRLLVITVSVVFALSFFHLHSSLAWSTKRARKHAPNIFHQNARRLFGLAHDYGMNAANKDLMQLLVNSYKSNAVCVVQVGANTGFALKAGSNRNEDDPLQAAVQFKETRGVLIEPVPSNFEKLVRNAAPYADRFSCLNAAVSGGNASSMTFYAIDEKRVQAEFPTAPQWFLNQIGSFERSRVINAVPFFKNKWVPREPSDYYVRSVNVKVVSASDVLNLLQQRYKQCTKGINFLHVDAEGLDWVITKHFLTQARPDVIIFEEKHLPRESIYEAQKLLRDLNYYSWFSGQNRYAVNIGSPVGLGS